MIYACDNCHFLFSRTGNPEQCPDCGKYAVREATEAEKQEFEERLKAPSELQRSFSSEDQNRKQPGS